MKKVETEEGAINRQRNWKVIKRKVMAEKKGRKVKKKEKKNCNMWPVFTWDIAELNNKKYD